jgi:hypothetical protein
MNAVCLFAVGKGRYHYTLNIYVTIIKNTSSMRRRDKDRPCVKKGVQVYFYF